jgi:hypothetical protein
MTQPPAKFPYWWYAGPALLAIASGALFIFFLFDGLSHTTDNLVQVVVPGSSDLFLQKRGDYTVFLEEQSSAGGKIYSTTQPITGLSCKLSAKDSHDELRFTIPGLPRTTRLADVPENRSWHFISKNLECTCSLVTMAKTRGPRRLLRLAPVSHNEFFGQSCCPCFPCLVAAVRPSYFSP